MMRDARALGDKLVVIINNDNWLRLKKGYVFMPEQERREIIESFPFVDKVVLTDHRPKDPDMSVSRMLKKIRPSVFANGGDRTGKTTPEDALCIELGISRAYGVGAGGKVQSSSWMIRDAVEGLLRSVRPWGHFSSWDKGDGWYLKTITVKPRQRLSLQYHHHRSEVWLLVAGDATATLRDAAGIDRTYALKKGELFNVPRGAVHRLESQKGGTVVEVAYGTFDENDIVRLQDDHGRV
jgi:mannose-6-phosphate isomerase-like protein (cupin superfamily)/glycerol-3-phosphate cytidylyltransferase-like family protein